MVPVLRLGYLEGYLEAEVQYLYKLDLLRVRGRNV